ncbi:acyltransferase family protein [Pseudomonas sp. TNT3]|uniref:acyltransferase family protein n=1 Tax=Pseudomonas sp. TNT3 TaxID=2654097 RepID=UPI00139190D3|nr:acyltransferase family protein [Pseudomonas sp. TNT3]KAI2689536.1 acyltransferase family protein [Pseudomonas sp. TNT3]
MENAGSRSLTIDSFRGLGILLVVLGHTTGLPSWLHNFIYSFHMPAFFILSGYLFNPEKSIQSPVRQVERKFYRLIMPAWTLGLACGIPFLAMLVLNKGGIDLHVFFEKLLGTLVGYTNTQYNFESTPVWFLFALFITEVCAIACYATFRNNSIYVLYMIGVVGVIISFEVNNYTLFNCAIALTATLFFAVGITAKTVLSKKTIPVTLVGVVSAGMLFATNYITPAAISMAENFIAQPQWLLINVGGALSGTALLYLIARLVNSKALSWVGKMTLPILAFNYIVNIACHKALSNLGMASWPLTFFVQVVVLLAVAYFVSRVKLLDVLFNGKLAPTYGKRTITDS